SSPNPDAFTSSRLLTRSKVVVRAGSALRDLADRRRLQFGVNKLLTTFGASITGESLDRIFLKSTAQLSAPGFKITQRATRSSAKVAICARHLHCSGVAFGIVQEKPMNRSGRTPDTEYSPSLADTIYRPFFVAGITTVLTLGCVWGAINLFT